MDMEYYSLQFNIFLILLALYSPLIGWKPYFCEAQEQYLTSSNVNKILSTLQQGIDTVEWKEKSNRLSALEERQQRAEVSIMKLTKQVHDLENEHNQLRQKFEDGREIEIEERTTMIGIVVNRDDVVTKNYTRTTTTVPSSYFESDEISDEDFLPEETEQIFVTPTYLTAENHVNSVQNDIYYVYGSPTSFKTLEPIPELTQTELSSIELHYVNIDPEVLKISLQNCTKLRSLKLVQVNFSDEMRENDRVVLPHLEEFFLDQVGVLMFRNDTIFSKWTEVDEFLKGFNKRNLKSLIFFDKTEENSWEIERISSLGTNIQILVDGLKIFTLNYDEGELNSMLKYTNDFLRYLDSNFFLRKVAISAWRLDLRLLPDTITHLNLNYVLDSNENFSRKLQKFSSLQALNIFIGNQRSYGWSLAAIPQLQIKNLTIRYSDIREFPMSRLLRLDHLYLHLTQFDLNFVQAFPSVFETIYMGVTFRRDNSSNGLHHLFLQNILGTPVKWIFMQNFDRNFTYPTGIPSVRIFRNMEQFLSRSGIPKGVKHFILEFINGVWQGRVLSKHELDLMTLQLVGTDKFVTFDTYYRIIE